MLKVEALVKPLVLDELLQQLIQIGVHSLSYFEIYAANKPLLPSERETADQLLEPSFTPHIKLEIIVDKAHLSAIQDALAEKVSPPLIGGAEVTVIRLKEGLRVLAGSIGEPEVEGI